MKVGVVTYRLDRKFTGIGKYTVELVKALLTLPSAPIEIVLFSAGDPLPLYNLQGLTIVPIPFCRRYPALVTLAHLILPMLAIRHRVDLLHDPNGLAPFGLSHLAFPTILTLHDILPISMPGNSTKLDTLVYQKWLPYISKRVSAIITPSGSSKRDIVTHLGVCEERVHAIPSGVSAAYKPLQPEAIAPVKAKYALPENYILFVGSLEKRKNLVRLLQACQRLWSTGLQIPVVLVGPIPSNSEIGVDLALPPVDRAGGASDLVRVLGYVLEAELPALYAGATALVLPSLYEGFGLPILEAMACGTPVICSNTSAMPEVGGQAAMYVDPHDYQAMATAIASICTDSERRVLMSARGVDRAQAFTWSHTARQTIEVYRRVLR
jgi:glycosyltransferase involved in cell wall biosynthesis